VDAACRDVGGDEASTRPILNMASALSRWFCERPPWMAGARTARALELLREAIGTAPCAAEDDRRARGRTSSR